MENSNDYPFITISEKNGVSNSFLSHYTKFENFLKIIYYKNFRLSSLYSLNDKTEPRLKVTFAESISIDIQEKINHFLITLIKNIRILSLCQDSTNCEKIMHEESNDLYYTDFTSKSFALPRMWSQYSANNTGICLILNKKKLIEEAKNTHMYLYDASVRYVPAYQSYFIDENCKNKILEYQKLNHNSAADRNFLEKELKQFLLTNCFTKLYDWVAESEYRIALWDDQDITAIGNLPKYLSAIVVGEDTDRAHIDVIQKVNPVKIPVQQIAFHARGIHLCDANMT